MQLDPAITGLVNQHFKNYVPKLTEFLDHVALLEEFKAGHELVLATKDDEITGLKATMQRMAANPDYSPLQEKVDCLSAENWQLKVENAKLCGKKHGLKKGLKCVKKMFELSRTKIKKKKHWHWDLLKGQVPDCPVKP